MYNLPLKLNYFWQNKFLLREEVEEVEVGVVEEAVGEVAVELVVHQLR